MRKMSSAALSLALPPYMNNDTFTICIIYTSALSLFILVGVNSKIFSCQQYYKLYNLALLAVSIRPEMALLTRLINGPFRPTRTLDLKIYTELCK